MTPEHSELQREAPSSHEQSLASLWWNTNVPAKDHTPGCPPYLLYAFDNAKDRSILSTANEDHNRQTWPEVQHLIRENRLENFTRVPSELRAYRQFCSDVGESHGSVLNFILNERLHWELEGQDASRGMTFDDPSESSVLSFSHQLCPG